MPEEIKNPVLRFVVHAHLMLAVCAAAQVWWIDDAWFGRADGRKCLAAFFGTFACYGLLRLVRSREAGLAQVPVFTWYRKHRVAMLVAVAASAVLALVALGTEVSGTMVRLWPVIVPALLYVVPFHGRDGHLFGLRRIPVIKSFLVAWVWAGGTVLLAADEMSGVAWLLVFVLFCFYLAVAIAFDLRDREVDPPALRTIPQLFGPKLAKALAALLLLPITWMLVVSHALHAADDRNAALLTPLLGLGLALIVLLRSAPQRGWAHWLLLDACIGLLPLLAWVEGNW